MNPEYLDLRELAARLEELTDRYNDDDADELDVDELAEFNALLAVERDLGGDLDLFARNEPTAIREDTFTAYAEEFAEDIGAVQSGATWPNNHIDWEAAADELKADYTEFDYDGYTWLVRA